MGNAMGGRLSLHVPLLSIEEVMAPVAIGLVRLRPLLPS